MIVGEPISPIITAADCRGVTLSERITCLGIRVGLDTGGTFTGLVAIDEDRGVLYTSENPPILPSS
jgi:hypothetical protein